MKPTFIVSILIFSFIATCSTFAQQSTEHISGRVTDTNGEPLPGATISIKGERTGAVTSADGTYTLQLPGIGSYIITASYIGYQTEEKRITTEKEKKIKLPFIRRSVRPRNSRCNRYPYSQIAEGRSHHHPGNHLR